MGQLDINGTLKLEPEVEILGDAEKVYKPVYVTWVDSTAQSGWHDGHEVKEFVNNEPLRIQSLGWMISEEGNWIVLAMSVCESRAGELLKIPQSVVESVKFL